ncbi:IS4 family transposase [Escherichia coli]|uniref:IS4 family transposase n=1 Tax=Escherichia coli TaxID=562 RepID=UPI000A58C1E2|nr:IS4 family transposase [Escherichia coli]
MVLSDCYSWDNEQSGHARLGDPRRTRRLVSLTSSLAQHAGLSIVKSSQSTAQVEGAYRLIRNPSVSPQAIAEAGFTATVRACEAHPLLLALEDTTTINFSHSTASDDQGNTTTNPKTHGLLAHSVLMYAPDSALPVGFIEQQRWSRVTDTYGVKHQRKERPCEEKESYRWQQASERMAERLGEIQKRVITVCDREADIWHYLHYKVSHGQRFVVRAAQNSRLEEAPGKLFELPEVLATAGSHTLNVMQKGGRAARQARMFIRYSEVSIKIATTVASAADARRIVSHYERRWLIEEYHKAWKSGGTCVESLRMQTRDNRKRLVRTVLIFTESSDQLSRATDRVPGLPASPGYVQ